MRKKKFKFILTLGISALGIASLSACTNGGGKTSSSSIPTKTPTTVVTPTTTITKEPTQKPSHTHSWESDYSYDEVNHWLYCSDEACDMVYKMAPHSLVDNVCEVCGYERETEEELKILGITAYDHMQNSRRVTQLLQKVYNVGDTFSTTNLALRITKRENRVETTENLPLSSAEIIAPDMSTPGVKDVIIKYGDVETSYTITVLDLSSVDNTKATVTVDSKADPSVSGNTITVNSINDAVRVFKLIKASDNTIKQINVKEGVYHEKVEFDIPNIYIKGENTDATKTMIEYDLIAAYITPGGTTEYSTDGSASVSIRETAMGFHAENITFQNYWNTNARYEQSKIIANDGLSGNTQAVACLVQADKCVFDNVRFSGYHDTLYSQKGRHIYNKCHIEGRTDYIFGDTATSYFNECTILTIGANSNTNGGYIIATRGCQSGENDTVEYGYIFNNCTITADQYVKAGTASIARAWANYMTLAFINCNISEAYSKTAYGVKADNKNDRYTSMAGEPNAALLFEYNNTGLGALSETTPGTIEKLCTIISEERAADFLDYSKIFAKINGKFSYASAWDGTPGTFVPVTYYFIEYEAQSSVKTNGENHSLFGGALLVNGQYRMCGSSNGCVQVNAGTVFTLTTPGAVSIDWYGNGYGRAENGIITYKNGYATIEITDAGDANIYIKSITVDPTQPAIHEHEYGDFEVIAPTLDIEGSATRVCLDCELEEAYVDVITLPVLSQDNYTITSSENAGMSIYTYTVDGLTISFEAEALAGLHVHTYGEWKVLEENKPTLDSTGKMTRECNLSDCDLSTDYIQSQELPALTDSAYVITNNTATLTEEGTGTYTITINDVTVSFEAVTKVLDPTVSYSFTTIEAGSYSATEDAPYSIYNGDITLVGGWRFSNVGTQVNKGTVIKVHVQGAVTVEWFGGSYGTEADGDITYSGGYATITIIGTGSGSGVYIKGITVDRTDIVEDAAIYTVTINGDDTVYGSLEITEGKKISLDDIEALIPVIYNVSAIYTSSEKTLEYDLDQSVSSNLDLYIEVVESTDPITLSFADYAQNATPEEFFDGYLTINSGEKGYWLNGSAIRVYAGDTIVLGIKGEVTVEWFGSSYGSEANGVITYDENGYATITIVDDTLATGGIYIKSITVTPSAE